MARKLTTAEFKEKAIAVHGNRYDYSKVEYKGTHDKVIIICPEHGEFEQTPNKHLRGQGCPKCHYKRLSDAFTKDKDQFIKDAIKVHGNKYDYSKVEYVNNKTKVCIICPKHGEFWQEPYSHLRGKGCPVCFESKGENEVSTILDKRGVVYKRQLAIESDVNTYGYLYVDFYLPDYNTIIEFNGKQHYMCVEGLGGKLAFDKQKARDEELRQYCKDHNIKLIEIRYDQDVWVELEAQLFNAENINHS
jgi:hypothetical protein